MTENNDSTTDTASETTKKERTLNLRGTDMLKTPCFKETMMGSIGITTILAVGYNFATSKSPKRILQIVFPISYFGNWFACRFVHHDQVMKNKRMKELIGTDKFSEYAKMSPEERQTKDEEWAKRIKKTRPKDYRDD